MKILLFGLFSFYTFQFVFSQTATDAENIAKSGLNQQIVSESQGALKLINFKKLKGKTSEFDNEIFYELEFQIEIEVVKNYYLNTSLTKPFVGVSGSGWKYFECTIQGDGFLYKMKLTEGNKYSLIGNATLIEKNNGYSFSGYEITSHKQISNSLSNDTEEKTTTLPISTSKNVYCKYEKGSLVGVSEQNAKYVGYWSNMDNECFAILFKEGVFKIFMDCSYNAKTNATFTTTDSQIEIEPGAQFTFNIDTTTYTLKYYNDCYLMKITKFENHAKNNVYEKVSGIGDTVDFKGLEAHQKYFGLWVNEENKCLEIKPNGSTINIGKGIYKEGVLTLNSNYMGLPKGKYIHFKDGTLEKTIFLDSENSIQVNESFKKTLDEAFYYDIKLASDNHLLTLLSIKYTDNSYYNESIYPRYKLKNDVFAYIDSSERFNLLAEINNSKAQSVLNADFKITLYALQTGQMLYKGGATLEIIVKDFNNEVLDSCKLKIETGFLSDYKSEKDAILAIKNRVDELVYRAIWSCFPINAQIMEILERDKKGNAKTVKINAGHEMGVFKNFQFRIDDPQIINGESKNKGQLQVITVNDDGTSICKVLGQSETITNAIESGKLISVTTIYDDLE